ncbi:unnamed protein product [Albugo candida]|uniref:Uncharacterized protein n=1 Tax=Albugo candida TaxID=65357 RepID=A0A024FUX9_9STRA|nr:unnamed protein product [Albugo candida]|eukprot:CCI10851.1 unnamed protein product [Albugo candida]
MDGLDNINSLQVARSDSLGSIEWALYLRIFSIERILQTHGLVKPSTTPAIDLGFSHRSIQTRAFAFENTFLIESKDLFANTIDGAERDYNQRHNNRLKRAYRYDSSSIYAFTDHSVRWTLQLTLAIGFGFRAPTGPNSQFKGSASTQSTLSSPCDVKNRLHQRILLLLHFLSISRISRLYVSIRPNCKCPILHLQQIVELEQTSRAVTVFVHIRWKFRFDLELSGSFTLQYFNSPTSPVAFDITSYDMKNLSKSCRLSARPTLINQSMAFG